MQSIEGFDFFALTFDGDGKPEPGDELRELEQHVTAVTATDAIVIAHGFRNDAHDATRIYSGFLNTFRAHLGRPELAPALADRRFAVAGVYWPSKAFRETFDDDTEGTRSLGDADLMAKVAARLAGLKDSVAPSSAAHTAIDRAMALLPTLQEIPQRRTSSSASCSRSSATATLMPPRAWSRSGTARFRAAGTHRRVTRCVWLNRRSRQPVSQPDNVVSDEGPGGQGRSGRCGRCHPAPGEASTRR